MTIHLTQKVSAVCRSIVVATALALVVACDSERAEQVPDDPGVAVGAPPVSDEVVPAETAAQPQSDCDEPTSEQIDAVNGQFAEAGTTIAQAQILVTAEGIVLIGGNIVGPNGEDLSRSDVWAIGADALAIPITGSARDASLMPAPSNAAEVAGGDLSLAVQRCVQALPVG